MKNRILTLRGSCLRPLKALALLLLSACATPPRVASTITPQSGLSQPTTAHRVTTIDGLKIFYREAGDPAKPTILLLHGYPSSSHMFRELIPKLSTRFHLLAPDYPGFGYSDAPAPEWGPITFESITNVVEHFALAQGLRHFSLYMQDFGGPVGMRLATRHPTWIDGLVIQNANAYEEGLAQVVREGNSRRSIQPDSEADMKFELGPGLAALLYKTGARSPDTMNPDGWSFDMWALEQAGHRRVAAALLNDYFHNIEQYPRWHSYLQSHKPPVLVVWGKGDPIFLVPGAEAYRRDLPDVRIRYFDTSHFALEEDSEGIAAEIQRFFGR